MGSWRALYGFCVVLLTAASLHQVSSQCKTVEKQIAECNPNASTTLTLTCPADHMILVRKITYERRDLPTDGSCPDPYDDGGDICVVSEGSHSCAAGATSCQLDDLDSRTETGQCNDEASNYVRARYQCQPAHNVAGSNTIARALQDDSTMWSGTMAHVDSDATWWKNPVNGSETGCRIQMEADSLWWMKMLFFFKQDDDGNDISDPVDADGKCKHYVYVTDPDDAGGPWTICSRHDAGNPNSLRGDPDDYMEEDCHESGNRTLHLRYITDDYDVNVMFSLLIATAHDGDGLHLECGIPVNELTIDDPTRGDDDGVGWLPITIAMIIFALVIFFLILCVVCWRTRYDRKKDGEEEDNPAYNNYAYVGKGMYLDGDQRTQLVMEKSLTPMGTTAHCQYCKQ